MVGIIILGWIPMKNKTEKIYTNYRNFVKEKNRLKSIHQRFTEKTRQFAVEYADKVIDHEGTGFVMYRDKRPVDFFRRLYQINYETKLRILSYDTDE